MTATGYLHTLTPEPADPVEYRIRLDEAEIPLNPALGRTIRIAFQGEKACIHCGRKIKKTFASGFCYPCFTTLPETDLCYVKPSLCHFHQGTCRDATFGKSYCMQAHYVYLALSSEVKVGITRKPHAVRRWLDQGAVAALPIAEVPDRKTAGELELHLAQFISDKTDWRKMLKDEIADADLLSVRQELVARIPEEFRTYLLADGEVYTFRYPRLEQAGKIRSLNLDKQDEIQGTLVGIKGQYLILDHGVFNVRKHAGYKVVLEC
jgi:Protein of unknown function (DUF2797)